MPAPIILLVYVLAVARVVRLITKDEILARPRNAVIDRVYRRAYGFRAELAEHKPVPKLAYLIVCPWCMSIYVTAMAAPIVYFAGRSPWLAVPALALAGSYIVGYLASHEG